MTSCTGEGAIPLLLSLSFFRAELVLTDRAQRAEPILRDLFPRRAGGNAVLRVADGRVIDIAADIADILHSRSSCGKYSAEVALQQALERLAVRTFIAGHFMDGDMDGIGVILLSDLGQLDLTGRCAEFGFSFLFMQ